MAGRCQKAIFNEVSWSPKIQMQATAPTKKDWAESKRLKNNMKLSPVTQEGLRKTQRTQGHQEQNRQTDKEKKRTDCIQKD